jgi:hypothetical protein
MTTELQIILNADYIEIKQKSQVHRENPATHVTITRPDLRCTQQYMQDAWMLLPRTATGVHLPVTSVYFRRIPEYEHWR